MAGKQSELRSKVGNLGLVDEVPGRPLGCVGHWVEAPGGQGLCLSGPSSMTQHLAHRRPLGNCSIGERMNDTRWNVKMGPRNGFWRFAQQLQ